MIDLPARVGNIVPRATAGPSTPPPIRAGRTEPGGLDALHDPSDSPGEQDKLPETRILLLRHAETSAPDRFHGAESDVGLGERGRRQADAVAQILAAERPAAVYSSAMRRALETAGPIARACGLSTTVVPALHERRMGPLSGQSRGEGLDAYAEAKSRWMSGELDYTHEGGESYAEIRRRVVTVLERIVVEVAGRTAVVVAHGVVIRVLLTTILPGHGPAEFDRFAIDNTAVNDLCWDGACWSALALNQRVVSEAGFDTFSW
jgi:broad specificity phosphatase PhoE